MNSLVWAVEIGLSIRIRLRKENWDGLGWLDLYDESALACFKSRFVTGHDRGRAERTSTSLLTRPARSEAERL